MVNARTIPLICGAAVLLSCGGPAKPVIQANPDFGNCSADKSIIENQCLKDNPTREGFDRCIAEKRKSCVDGGAP